MGISTTSPSTRTSSSPLHQIAAGEVHQRQGFNRAGYTLDVSPLRCDAPDFREWDCHTAEGRPGFCGSGNTQCVGARWDLFWSAYDRQQGGVTWDNWWGTLLQQKRDKSGLEYKRNRYYDPQTGRLPERGSEA